MTKQKATYFDSPIGVFEHPWLNKPDTEFNKEGLWHVKVGLNGTDAEKLKQRIDAAVDATYDDFVKDKTPAERKKWSKLYPYEVLEDDDGAATGEIVFTFKQNAKIKLKDGTTKDVRPFVVDANGNDTKKAIFGGSEGRVKYSMRAIRVDSSKGVGIRLDFAGVQVTKLAQGSGGMGFGKIDGGYVDDSQDDSAPGSEDGIQSADY